MGRNLFRISQIFLLGFVCPLLMVPTELHSTITEIGAHDVQGAISVDARHADQEAHFEHSIVEIRSHCAACTLPQESETLSMVPDGGHQNLPQVGVLPPSNPFCLDSRAISYTPSRAPPLF